MSECEHYYKLHPGCPSCEEERSWVSVAERSNAIEAALKQLLDVIEAHECTCFSCDRDGEQYCDCLEREAKRARAALSPNASLERAERSDDTLEDIVRCENCGGSGVISFNPNLNPNSFPDVATAKCTRCGGTGIEDTANKGICDRDDTRPRQRRIADEKQKETPWITQH